MLEAGHTALPLKGADLRWVKAASFSCVLKRYVSYALFPVSRVPRLLWLEHPMHPVNTQLQQDELELPKRSIGITSGAVGVRKRLREEKRREEPCLEPHRPPGPKKFESGQMQLLAPSQSDSE